MGKYLVRRLVNYLILLVVAIIITYFLAGTFLYPRGLYEVRNPPLPPEAINSALSRLNINDQDPILGRFARWVSGIFRGDWGQSPDNGVVAEEIGRRMWVSLRLITLGALLGIVSGVAMGAWTATKQYKVSDRVTTFFSLLLISTPVFVVALILVMLVTQINQLTDANFGFRIFEFVGETGLRGDYPGAWLVDRAQHLFLPTLTLVLSGFAFYSRVQRNLMLDSLGADYVRTARAKGLRQQPAVMKHALRTSLIPVGTYVAFTVAGLFTGSAFMEKIFTFHGLGAYGVDTIIKQDPNGVVAVTAFAGVCTLAGALLSDIAVAILDPRVRLS